MSEQPTPIPILHLPPSYPNAAYGSWGEFGEPEGDDNYVLYLSAHVQLNENDENAPTGLVDSIAPVREVLPTKDLSFSELLQRDLEDHRVLHGLIPYLMRDQSALEQSRINFLPPLLAVLLPFSDGRPSQFASRNPTAVSQDPQTQLWQSVIESPGYFQFSRTAYDNHGELVRTHRTGSLRWNPLKAKLVVIDGQHRAMALLALYRTLGKRSGWPDSGSKYKFFYERALLDSYKDRPLPNIEVPVTICVFPGLLGSEGKIHVAARRLFVDVNKEAKQPNPSRLILLSESDLIAIFTRSLLDELRRLPADANGASYLPLAAIEYDTPGKQKASTSQRKTCVTNLEFIKYIVNIVMRCKAQLEDLGGEVQRDAIGTETSLQKQLFDLDVEDTLISTEVNPAEQRQFKITDLSSENFPEWALEKLRANFLDLHGRHLLKIFSRVEPYATFASEVIRLEREWDAVADEVSSLSKEALLDGVGTYWTLREYFDGWKGRLAKNPELRDSPPPVVNGWRVIEQKEKQFQENLAVSVTRCRLSRSEVTGFGDLSEEEAKAVIGPQGVNERARTLAVQAGLAAAWAGLVLQLKIPADKREQFTDLFIERVNSILLSESKSGFHRLYVFSSQHPGKASSQRFCRLDGLQPKLFMQMRIIWLEVFFAAQSNDSKIADLIGVDAFEQARADFMRRGRAALSMYIVRQELKKLGTEATATQKQAKHDETTAQIKVAYQNWFDEHLDQSEILGPKDAPISAEQQQSVMDGEDDEANYGLAEGE